MKPFYNHASLQQRAPNTYTWDFPDIIKLRVAVYTISEKAIQFWHADYNPDWAQKLISSSMSRHLSTCNISSKSMHMFLSNLAHRQTDRQTDRQMWANAFTHSSVGGNKVITMHLFLVTLSLKTESCFETAFCCTGLSVSLKDLSI